MAFVSSIQLLEDTQMIWSFLLGFFGVFLIEFWDYYETRTALSWPEYLKTSRYWIPTTIMMILGGILAMWPTGASPLTCIQIGASTPLIISRFLSGKEA